MGESNITMEMVVAAVDAFDLKQPALVAMRAALEAAWAVKDRPKPVNRGNLYHPHPLMVNSGEFWRCPHGTTGFGPGMRWEGCQQCAADDPEAYAKWHEKTNNKCWGEARDFHGPGCTFRFRPHIGGSLPGGRPGIPGVIDSIQGIRRMTGSHEAYMCVLPYAEAFIGRPYSEWLAIPEPRL